MLHVLYKELEYSHVLNFIVHMKLNLLQQNIFFQIVLFHMSTINYLGLDIQTLNLLS